jgi:hypothetical protein
VAASRALTRRVASIGDEGERVAASIPDHPTRYILRIGTSPRIDPGRDEDSTT